MHYANAVFCEITWEYESGKVGKPMEFLSQLIARGLSILTAFDLYDHKDGK